MGNCFSEMINFVSQMGNFFSQTGNSSSQMASTECERESSPSPSPSPSSSSTRQWKYEVFLSFMGEDTRKSFTDHLYAALKQNGIITFRDEEELEKGKSISKLFEAIQESQIAIIIFSKNYAYSKWCLKEVAKINKCRKEIGLIVLPVFYDVKPSDVKKQTGTFEQAFTDHQKCPEVNTKEVETWRTALKEVAIIKGWHLQDRHEFEFIQHIVKEIMKKLSSKSSSITKNFIGIASELEKFIPSYLGFENNARMTGIYGMGGLGKTTLARAVYDEYRSHFEGSSFIANVREDSKKHGLSKSQQQLLQDILKNKEICVSNDHDGVAEIKKRLCCKKVLLVIDDVDRLDQLEKLAGRNWFGLGSWIIITTRDEHVLIQHEVLNRYNPNGLNKDDALKLFCLKAFKNEQPKKDYMQLSQQVVKYANGLPLALVTLGSFLVGRTIDEWQSALSSFKKTEGEMFNVLKISYDGLEEMWKEIFLDIACFFRYWEINEVIYILENCGFNARIGISVLMERSLLSVDVNGYLGMHDLLQEMGKKIVRFESNGNLGKQGRWWLKDDLLHVSKENMATNAIEAIVVEHAQENFNYDEFLEVLPKMSNLRLMIITDYFFRNCQRHLDVPNQLRHLSWNNCPSNYLSFSSQPMKLVHLELQYSDLKYLWHGVMDLWNLKFIDLSYSYDLIRTPDFSGVPMLEKLNLSFCEGLVDIHPSIGQLSKLRYLNLQCCSKISTIPNFTGKMKCLSELNFNGTAIIRTPDFSGVPMLEKLNLSSCQELVEIHPSIGQLSKLRYLNLQACSKIRMIPNFTGKMKCLSELNFSGTAIIRTPDFSGVPMLEKLNLSSCPELVEIHPSIGQLSKLRYLNLQACSKISMIPNFTGKMKCLSELNFSGTAIMKVAPSSIECLTALTLLDLGECQYLKYLPSNMYNLRSLEKLNLCRCFNLKSLPRVPSTIRAVDAGFTFLEWSLAPIKLSRWSQPLSQWCPYGQSGIQKEFIILFHFQPLPGLLCRQTVYGTCSKREEDRSRTKFLIIFPSCLIRMARKSISIELPSNWSNSKWIGFALWAAVSMTKKQEDDIKIRMIALGDMPQNQWAFDLSTTLINFGVNKKIFLLYLSHDEWFDIVGSGKCSQIKVIFEFDESPINLGNRGFSLIESFGKEVLTKKLTDNDDLYDCGVSLIYEQDVDEFNQKNAQSLIESFGEKVSIYKLTVGDDDDDDDEDDEEL